jgi:hypothetical protein
MNRSITNAHDDALWFFSDLLIAIDFFVSNRAGPGAALVAAPGGVLWLQAKETCSYYERNGSQS